MADASARSSLAGQAFGAYRIEREIGHGGMATVYVAEDRRHGRRVALKVLNQKISSELGPDRFLREIQTAARLTHPHIVPLHDSGESENQLYYVMPLVAGESLRTRLARDGEFQVADALRLAGEIAEALDYAHRQGVVHRDVKPENILLAEGHCFVVDFGIAHAIEEAGGDRLTATGLILGTPAYMSPEQAGGERDIDARSDVFSLGAVLFEMLTGESPFRAPTAAATLARVMTASVRPVREHRSDVPADVDEVLDKALAKDRNGRFQSAGEMATRLHQLASQVSAERVGPAGLTKSFGRRYGLAAALGVAVIALGAAALWWRGSRAGAEATSPAAAQSVAVMTFSDETADSANAYFATGIAEELLNALADVPGLRVASRTASFSVDPAVRNPRDIGRLLGVTAILEGSVRRAHDSVRVNARLVNAADGSVIWSGATDGPATDVFAVQERIARTIVERMRVRLLDSQTQLVRRRTRDPRAYDLVLQARQLRRHNVREELLAATRLLDQALARDSTYAEAHAVMADVYESLAVFGDQVALPGGMSMTDGEMLRRARVAAQRAVDLDPQSGAAHFALGLLLFRYDWNWLAAEREFLRGLELQPASSNGHARFSRFLRSMGRFVEARARRDSARKYDGVTEEAAGLAMGRISYFEKDYARSIRETLADSTSTSRTYSDWLAQTYIGAGDLVKAESLLKRTPENRSIRATLAFVYAKTGRAREARALLAKNEGTSVAQPLMHAGVYAVLGDTAAALAELDRAILTRDPLVVDFKVSPVLDPLRSHPRFIAIMKQLAFP
ncbi:MAG TPA: protein kinase [Gemmatimonadaceae bacterium]|jgi:serine/threonine-protein kinase